MNIVDVDAEVSAKPSPFLNFSGKGLFAEKDFAKGDRIVQYIGEVLTKEQANEREDTYQLEIGPSTVIDASNLSLSSLGRYANHKARSYANAKFAVNRASKTAWIVATKAIPANSEIFVDYGPDYWRGRKNVKRNAPKTTHKKRAKKPSNARRKVPKIKSRLGIYK